LNVPCLIMRTKTERMEGLDKNAFLADFDKEKINDFLQRVPYLRQPMSEKSLQPSAKIVDHVASFGLSAR
jgi:UDP-N-acetylglucosamine 2-epimerase